MGLLEFFDLNQKRSIEEMKKIKGETFLEQIQYEINYLGDILGKTRNYIGDTLGTTSKSDKKLDDASKDTDKS